MTFNVDEATGGVSPWNLTLRLNGSDYPTQRPTVSFIGLLQGMKNLSADNVNEIAGQMFVGDLPTFQTVEQLSAAVSAYLAYFTDHTAKNGRLIAANVKAAMAAGASTSQGE